VQNYSLKFKILNFVLSFCILIFSFSFSPLVEISDAADKSSALIVKIVSGDYLSALQNYGQTELLFDNIYRLRAAISDLQAFRAQPWVKFVQKDAVLQNAATVTDPLFGNDPSDETKQWYLSKMQVPKAWEKTTGRPDIIVAVVDTGIDGQHEDLSDGRVGRGYMTYCQVIKSNNDCTLRITSVIDSGVNSDDNGHGTIVAGLIGAQAGNGRGISGVNRDIKLMPIKALDSKGNGLSSDVAVGIKWAADNGARIINLSIGGQGLEGLDVLQEAIAYAHNRGVLIVAAAGNDGSETGGNLNNSPVLPVCADGDKNMVIGVAAVDIADRKAKFSNYGSNCVDIVAPGTTSFVSRQEKRGIVSTYYDPAKPGKHDLYVYALGTSLAAPLVSGVAALTISAFPSLDVKALRDRVLASVDNIDQYNTSGCEDIGSCVGQLGSGRLNAIKAVSDLPLFAGGAVISGPTGLFLIERGLKRPISDFVFKQRFSGIIPVQTEQAQVDAFPNGSPVTPADGAVIKDTANPTVYLVEGGFLKPLSYLAFVSRRLSFENVAVLSPEELASYARGSDAAIVDGLLVKAGEPSVYIVNNGQRQIISNFVYKQRGLDRFPIARLSAEEINRYPINDHGNIYPPEDGTLIKGTSSATVYLIENGARRGITAAAFANRGFSFAGVHVLPQTEIDQYQLGVDIVE